MTKSSRHPRWRCVPIACWLCCALAADLHVSAAKATDPAAGQTTSRSDDDDNGDENDDDVSDDNADNADDGDDAENDE